MPNTPRKLFTDLGDLLLAYRRANAVEREGMLLNAVNALDHMPEEVTSKDAAIKAYKDLSYAATLIRYAEVLSDVENQRPFDILYDFATMIFEGEFRSLAEKFSINPDTSQMNLKCPLQDITLDDWKLFRKAQVAHILSIDARAVQEAEQKAREKARREGKTDGAEIAEAVRVAAAAVKRKADVFNFSRLDLDNPNLVLPADVLDPANPPLDQLLPIQIQMGGKLDNEAVDRTVVSPSGAYRFARRGALLQLPGGGMVEISNPKEVDGLKKKMLLEHLEEEHGNLHEKAAEMYDSIRDRAAFDRALRDVYESSQMNGLPSGIADQVQEGVDACVEKSAKIKRLVRNISALMAPIGADALEIGARIQPLTEELRQLNLRLPQMRQQLDQSTRTQGQLQERHAALLAEYQQLRQEQDRAEEERENVFVRDEREEERARVNAEQRARRLQALDQALRESTENLDAVGRSVWDARHNLEQSNDRITELTHYSAQLNAQRSELLQTHKALVELRAMVQVRPFELTDLFRRAFEYVKANTEEVLIQEYCDFRVLGGKQFSHSFVMKGEPLEDWFKREFKGVDGELADDISGAAVQRITLLQALGQFRSIRFSHILNVLANQIEAMNNNSLALEKTWNAAEYAAARQELKVAAQRLFMQNARALSPEQLWESADHLLGEAMSGLPESKKAGIYDAVEELRAKITNKASTPEEIKAAYAHFQASCAKILDKRHAVLLNSLLTILAVVATIVVAALIGFGIGFVAGLWTGPGAFFSGIAAGSAAAVSVLALTVAGGAVTGGLVGHGLFKKKNMDTQKQAVADYAENVERQIIPLLPSL